MSGLNPRAIATLGVGFGAVSIAYLGLWPTGTPVVPPTLPGGGISQPVITAPYTRPAILQDDRELLEIIPIIIEVLNGRR